MESFCDISKLRELFNPKKNASSDSEEENDNDASSSNKQGNILILKSYC